MDLRTLFIVSSVIVAVGFLISYVSFLSLKYYRGLRLWLAGMLSLLSGLLLIGLRDTVPSIISIHLANALIILTPSLIFHSFQSFFQKKQYIITVYSMAAFFILLFQYTAIFYGLKERIQVVSLAYFILWIPPALAVFRDPGVRSGVNYILFISQLIFSLISLVRFVYTGHVRPDQDFLELKGIQSIYVLLNIGMVFAMLSGFLLLVIKRLMSDLEDTNESLRSALVTRDRFMSIIAHDLKGPLGAIQLTADILKEDLEEQQGQTIRVEMIGIVDKIRKQSHRIRKLLEDLLDWANSHDNRLIYTLKEVDLKDLFIPSLDLYREIIAGHNIQLKVEYPEKMNVVCDQQSARTVIRNVLNNAVKFTPKNGEIRISFKEDEENFIALEIENDGGGFPDQVLQKLSSGEKPTSCVGFTGEKGSGMGLLLAGEYMRGAGGQLILKNRHGCALARLLFRKA